PVFAIAAAAALAGTLLFGGLNPLSAALALGLLAALAPALGAGRPATGGRLLSATASLALVASLGIASRPLFTFAPEAAIRHRPPVSGAIGELTRRALRATARGFWERS